MKRCSATCKTTGKRCKNKTETKFCAVHKRKSSTKRKTVKRKTVKRKSTVKSKRRQKGGG